MAFCRFPSYNKVKISKTIINSCLTQKQSFQNMTYGVLLFKFFFYFEIMKYFRSPDTSQLKSFLILGNFSYHHSKKNILLFIRLSQKSSVTITSTKFMFSVKQIEIKKCAFFCFSLKRRKQNILTH